MAMTGILFENPLKLVALGVGLFMLVVWLSLFAWLSVYSDDIGAPIMLIVFYAGALSTILVSLGLWLLAGARQQKEETT